MVQLIEVDQFDGFDSMGEFDSIDAFDVVVLVFSEINRDISYITVYSIIHTLRKSLFHKIRIPYSDALFPYMVTSTPYKEV